ncbi:DNA-binding LytR/AlgR family response regulator [Flavobacterium sp. CG_23.5]|uniref:LytR/AlgR family response regulator transcription factor n=1 Tax=unclassified Flavobacterium TaxID=196869 RepID=UPI0018CB4085|nr:MULTISPECIES: LytTR family DNA-binding domain-containing protein [unclassified Flavobacterium]MBG6109269.1 DNA-binding LytR/AlgR family response regulator [Flavobacterium sp. CG_9.10]MBP2283470.1 DNA-binding LytR/AlgR family response regulator [Flavobacterium sp. CG_23.5]
MNYSYIIIDDNQESVLNTKAVADGFSELIFVAEANNYTAGLNLILEHQPDLIFLEIDSAKKESNLSLNLINELHRYLQVIPKIIITTSKKDLAFEAIQYGVTDYLLKPLMKIDFIKLILKLNKSEIQSQTTTEQSIILDEIPTNLPQQKPTSEEKPLILCVKSYGDYRYIDAKDICYLQADNNSTDIHLNNGEMITAFKTLKHFEGILSAPFIRIHNSYIVNRNYISRIHTGNTVCYIKNTTVKLPFSKSYKSNIDLIISEFNNGNYLEI